MLMHELPASSLKCRAQPNVFMGSFELYDQMLYHRTILEPHTVYPIPAETSYIVLTVKKTAFGLDIIPKSLLSHLIQKGFHLGDFRKMEKFDQTPYKLPPPTPAHVPAEKRPLEERVHAFLQESIQSVHHSRLVSRRPQPELTIAKPPVTEPVQIPEPAQIHFPELNTLELTLTDATSLDQLDVVRI
ncbi:uncharacterized protein TNCV_3485551 [Trichonephila clavipes]|nr:uncharacterized protein TNCV_3485551 [Trichonephila clavipes]